MDVRDPKRNSVPKRTSLWTMNVVGGGAARARPRGRWRPSTLSRAARLCAAAAGVSGLCWSAPAQADEPNGPVQEPASSATPDGPVQAPASSDRPTTEAASRRPRFGAIAGLGFPRPLSVEALVKVDDFVTVGAEYGVLPALTVDSVDTTLTSFAFDGRVFPFRNAFFVGLRAGHQHVNASTAVTVASVATVDETFALDSWFLNPRLGLLWTGTTGLTIGAELGIQIPISPSLASSLPLALAPDAERTANMLGRTVLPTINVLQIGMLF